MINQPTPNPQPPDPITPKSQASNPQGPAPLLPGMGAPIQPGPPLSVSAPIRDTTINWFTVAIVGGGIVLVLILVLAVVMIIGALFGGPTHTSG